MTGLADLNIEETRGVTVARISGEVDASNADEIERRILAAVSNQVPGAVIDVSAAEYFDSAGVRLLFAVGQSLERRGQSLRVVVPSRAVVADVLETVRLADEVAIDASLDAAVDGLADA